MLDKQKTIWREKMLYHRNKHYQIDRDVWSSEIVGHLIRAMEWNRSSVFVYLNTIYEPNLRHYSEQLIEQGSKLYSPKIDQNIMKTAELRSTRAVHPCMYGIDTPTNPRFYSGAVQTALIPGVAFGKDGARIGHGAGYYDRRCAAHPSAYKIGVCFGYQLQDDKLPMSRFDQYMDAIVTEDGFFICR